jgi:hypothetical protein
MLHLRVITRRQSIILAGDDHEFRVARSDATRNFEDFCRRSASEPLTKTTRLESRIAASKSLAFDSPAQRHDDDWQARIRDAVAEIVDDLSSHNDGVDRKLPQPESESQAESPLAVQRG